MLVPRLGHINFINCLPLEYGLTEGCFGQGLDIRRDVPSNLNRLVVEGQLDVSPVSSIVYARNADKLLLLPDLSISAAGALESILLVSRKPIEQLDGDRISLTAKSATSHEQLKIVLHYAYGVSPEYFVSAKSLAEGVLDEAEAALYIGDDALTAYHHRQDGLLYYDMGDEWRKLTGGGMIYAVWVANRLFAERHPEALGMVHDRVQRGFAHGLARLSDAAATLNGRGSLKQEQVQHYIGLLNYQLSENHQAALLNYYKLAQGIGQVPGVPQLEFARVKL